MNSDRVNVKQQRLQDVQKTLLTVCAATVKLGMVTEESAKALEELAARWRYAKEDLDVTVEMARKNERSKR
jgi:hypothetical protein